MVGTDEDETWRAGRPRPWPHCARWGPSSPSPKGARPPIFRPNPLQPNGCVDQDATLYGPGDFVLDGDPAPPPQKRGQNPPKKISAHVYGGQTAGWIKMVLGVEACLSPVDFVLDGDPPPPPLNFRPMLIVVIVISLGHCTGVRRYWFVQVQV